MNRRRQISPNSSANRPESFHKYLKPGALARLRDSRITARSFRFNSLSQIYLRRAPPMESPAVSPDGQSETDVADVADVAGDFPLAGRIYGPLCLKRKKLAAIKPSWFSISNFQAPTADLTPDPISDVAAH